MGVLSLAAIAVLLLAFAVSGCGSSDGGDATTPTAAEGAASGPTGGGSGADESGPDSGEEAKKSKARSDSGKTADGKSEKEKTGAKQGDEGSGDSRSAEVKRKLAKACPQGMDEKTCRRYIEASLAAKEGDSNTTRVSGPEDCVEVMSRAECEELLAQQKQAEEESSTVNTEECMKNPTPRCEEVLREDLERQQAAGQAGG